MRIQILLGSVFMLWAGLVLGVSFLATPVKFMAPSLTMPVALEIGSVTFHSFNILEWVVLSAIFLLAFATPVPAFIRVVIGCLLAVMLVETFWLLPVLDMRVQAVILGQTAMPGYHHHLYIVAEIAKLLLAVFGGWRTLSMRSV